MPILVTEQLGPTQSLTPEGYLLCANVPIARTGSQIYAAHELPQLDAGRDGLITVHREESEVFRPETLASFEGKSVTIFHQFVDPNNVKRVEVGHAQNIRRSEVERDLLVADLLIKDARAIALVRDDAKPLREISCGYDAEYYQGEPGVAYQRNIIGNHIALVERGRAGPRCSIQDEDYMPTPNAKKPTLIQKLLRAFRTGDAALMARAADEAEEEMKQIEDEEREEALRAKDEEIAALKKTIDEMCEKMSTATPTPQAPAENQVGDECKEPDEEEKQKTADAMAVFASRAEMLVPGFKAPTADSAPRRLADVAVIQRKVLSDAMKTEDGRDIVQPLIDATAPAGARTVDGMSPAEVATVFVAASEVARQRNNARGARSAQARTKDFGATVSPAEINKRNAEFYKNRPSF